MELPGFFDLSDRAALLERLGDHLPKIDKIVERGGFRSELEQTRDKPRKSKAGRKPFDAVLMFKVLVLQQMCNRGAAPGAVPTHTPEIEAPVLRLVGGPAATRHHTPIGLL